MPAYRLTCQTVWALLLGLVLTDLAAAGIYESRVIADNPIGYYRFLETTGTVAATEVGSYDGAYVGFVDADLGQPSTVDPPDNRAARFNGSESPAANTNHVVIDRNLLAGIGTGAFTVEFLTEKTGTARGDLLNLKGTGGDLGLIWDSDQKLFAYWNGIVAAKAATVSLDQSHHIVLTRDTEQKVTLYVDGLVYSTGTSTADINAIQHAIWLGSNQNSDTPSVGFTGLIDDVAFYDHGLSKNQVQAHTAGALSYETIVQSHQPVYYYRLNEAAGVATATDSSGNDRTGTIQGATLGQAGASPRLGTAARFDGNDLLQTDDLAPVLGSTASLEFWIKTEPGYAAMSANPWDAPGVAGVDTNTGGNDIFWGAFDQQGRIYAQAGNGARKVSSDPINDGLWHHVVFTRDAITGEILLYIDGVQDGSGVISENGAKTTPFSWLGFLGNNEVPSDTRGYLQAWLDEIAIYDRVLTADEISLHYAAAMVPEPSTLALVVVGLGGLAVGARRRLHG